MLRYRALSLFFAAVLLAGCAGAEGDPAPASGGVGVVATTTHVADIARNVGGERVAVSGMLAANADPHDYELRPRDVEALSEADLVVRSGGDLDEWLTEAIEGSGTDAPVLNLIDHVRTIEGGEHAGEEDHAAGEEDRGAGDEDHGAGDEDHAADGVDPHWWQDPRNAVRATEEIRDALIAADPEGRQSYADNADAYIAELEELDSAVAACMRDIPEDRRKLVSTHDSLGYYADRYDIEVIGAVIPSLSTQGQPSAGETRELVETIRREDVEVIFTESSVDPKVEQAIADEAGATIGAPLWADTLGPEGSRAATYVEAVASNTRALAEGFTGADATCSLPS